MKRKKIKNFYMSNRKLKGIIFVVIAVVLMGAVGTGAYWTYSNLPALLADSKLYTETDLNKAYENGIKETVQKEHSQLVEYVLELEDINLNNQNKIKSLTEKLLNSELVIEQKERVIEELNNNILELNNTISELNEYINELEQTILDLEQENYSLRQNIAVLEEQKANLLQSIYAYEQLVLSLNEEILGQRFIVTFMFDDTIYGLVLVPTAEKVEIEYPEVVSTTHVIFLGWSESLDGDLIDLATWTPTADTVLYAKIIRKYDVNFVFDNKTHATRLAVKGDSIPTVSFGTVIAPEDLVTVINPDNTNRIGFLGWSLDGVNIIDTSTIKILEHTVFYAVCSYRYIIEFIVPNVGSLGNDILISSIYYLPNEQLNLPVAPQYFGYDFIGWFYNDNEVLESLNISNDIIVEARYNSYEQSITSSNGYLYGREYILSVTCDIIQLKQFSSLLIGLDTASFNYLKVNVRYLTSNYYDYPNHLFEKDIYYDRFYLVSDGLSFNLSYYSNYESFVFTFMKTQYIELFTTFYLDDIVFAFTNDYIVLV